MTRATCWKLLPPPGGIYFGAAPDFVSAPAIYREWGARTAHVGDPDAHLLLVTARL